MVLFNETEQSRRKGKLPVSIYIHHTRRTRRATDASEFVTSIAVIARRFAHGRTKESRVNSVPVGNVIGGTSGEMLSHRRDDNLLPASYTRELSRTSWTDSSPSFASLPARSFSESTYRAGKRRREEGGGHEDCHLRDLVDPRATILSRRENFQTNERTNDELGNFLSSCVRRLQSIPSPCKSRRQEREWNPRRL